jgi:hypothetical protein
MISTLLTVVNQLEVLIPHTNRVRIKGIVVSWPQRRHQVLLETVDGRSRSSASIWRAPDYLLPSLRAKAQPLSRPALSHLDFVPGTSECLATSVVHVIPGSRIAYLCDGKRDLLVRRIRTWLLIGAFFLPSQLRLIRWSFLFLHWIRWQHVENRISGVYVPNTMKHLFIMSILGLE